MNIRIIEWGLLYSCSTYVKPDGSLTPEGKRAKECISNGGLLAGVGFLGSWLWVRLDGPRMISRCHCNQPFDVE